MVPDDRLTNQARQSSTDHPDEASAKDPDLAVVSTTDPAIASGQAGARPPGVRPDQTTLTENGQDSDKSQGRHSKDISRPKNDNHTYPEGKAQPTPQGWVRQIIIGVVALACGSTLTWTYMHFSSSENTNQAKRGDESQQSKKNESDSPSKKREDPSSGNEATSSTGGDNPSAQNGNLASRFETLRQRIDALSMPRDTNSPDLTALRLRMEEFARSIDVMRELPSRVRELQARQDRMEAEMKSRHDRSGDEARQVPPTLKPAVGDPPKPDVELAAILLPAANPVPTSDTLTEGILLFKKKDYSQAEVVFRTLRQTMPQDARVWYFSALANGLSTGQWEGETRSFVVQGAERERAGLPGTTLIDSAFADLSPASGKDWLASYRKQLVRR